MKTRLAIWVGMLTGILTANICLAQIKEPLSGSLKEVTVRGDALQRLVPSYQESVIDYEIAGGRLWIASFSGANGRKAKLALLTLAGDTIDVMHISKAPVSLETDCDGQVHVVFPGAFYNLSNSGDTMITLYGPLGLDQLESIRQCKQRLNDRTYYKLNHLERFEILYAWNQKGEEKLHSFYSFEEKNAAHANLEEIARMEALLSSGQFREAGRVNMQRMAWNRVTLRLMDASLLLWRDTLAIIDYEKNRRLFYDLSGKPLQEDPLQIATGKLRCYDVVKDEITGRFYVHHYRNRARQTIQELDLHTGVPIGQSVELTLPFAEKVKVHNGRIYYLDKGEHGPDVRSLYVQTGVPYR